MKKPIIISAVVVAGIGVIAALLSTAATSDTSVIEVNNDRVTKHFNMLIVPDLSNRIDITKHSKAVSDLDIINSILDNIAPVYLKSDNRRMNQKDHFQIILTNQQLINKHHVATVNFLIDFSRFDKQRDRIDYIMNRSEGSTLEKDVASMKSEVKALYAEAVKDCAGADIWSALKNLNTSQVIPKGSLKTLKTDDGNIFKNEYRNVMILMTDGYIEADMYSENYNTQKVHQCLSKKRIDAFKSAYKRNGKGRTLKQFFTEEGYGITPIINPLLEELEILVMEIDDRSLNTMGNATEEISDRDVIDLFWTDWLKKSGVKHFDFKSKASSIYEAESHILKFLK